jgi:hypothetical protein
VTRAVAGAKCLTDAAQGHVTGELPVAVIDLLESVDVDHRDRQELVLTAGPHNSVFST